MGRRVKIQVTALDIKRGIPDAACECPIARAMKRRFKGMGVGMPGVCTEWFTVGRNGTDIPLPAVATNFIRRFDGGEDVEPFHFTVKLP